MKSTSSTLKLLNKFYVYVLLDPRKPGYFRYGHWVFKFEPFYVGKGNTRRHLDHLSPSYLKANSLKARYNQHKTNKINRILSQGLDIKIRLVRENLYEAEAFDLETKLISKMGRHDLRLGPLVNKTNGGEGTAGRKAKKGFTENHRRKLSDATKEHQKTLSYIDRARISLSIQKGLKSVPKDEQARLNASRAEKVRQYWADMTKAQRAERGMRMSMGYSLRSDEQLLAHKQNRVKAQRARRRNELRV